MPHPPASMEEPASKAFTSTFGRADFEKAVGAAKEHIAAGDAFQSLT